MESITTASAGSRRQNHDFGSRARADFCAADDVASSSSFWGALPDLLLGAVRLVLRVEEGACLAFSESSFSESELMQKRRPVGGGPSWNTWPRWAPQRRQVTSTRASGSL